MKYIIHEMWPGSFDIDETDRAWPFLEDLWWGRLTIYREELATIADRLYKKTYKRFSTLDFYGFYLEKMEVIQKAVRNKSVVNLKLTLVNEEEKYEVLFRGILRFEVGETESVIESKEGDIYGFSEILPVDDETLSFEVVFSSGMTLFVLFPNKALRFKKL